MKLISSMKPHIKSNNTSFKIKLNLLIALLPILIYKIILNNNLSFIYYISIILINISILVLIDLIIKKKKFDIYNYFIPIYSLLTLYLFIPNTFSYITILLTTLIINIIYKFYNKFNPVSLLLLSLLIIDKELFVNNYNTIITSILLLVSLIYLIFTRSIKFRTVLLFILISLLSILFNDFNIILIIIGVYVISLHGSLPNKAVLQYIYGIILGVVALLTNSLILLIFILISSLFMHRVDLFYSLLLQKK